MSDVIITIISLFGGAVFASISGIIVTTWIDSKKEKKLMTAFKLEFKLHINKLYQRLDGFKELYNSNEFDKADEYVSKTFINNSIFHNYSRISMISKINIELYYDIVTKLEEIDKMILSLTPSSEQPEKIEFKDTIREAYYNPIWEKIYEFVNNHLQDVKDIKELLE